MQSLGHLPRSYWTLLAATLVVRLGGWLASFLTIYLSQGKGWSVSAAAIGLSAYGAGGMLGGLAGGFAADMLGRRPTMVIAMALLASMAAALANSDGPALVYACAFGCGLATELYRPAAAAAVADIVAAEHRALAFGLIYWASNIGFAVAPLLGGWIAATISYDAAMSLNAVGAGVAGAILLIFLRLPPAARGRAAAVPAIGNPRDLLALLWVTLLSAATLALAGQGYSTLPLVLSAQGYGPVAYGTAIAFSSAVIVLLTLPVARAVRALQDTLVLALAAALIGLGLSAHAVAGSLSAHFGAVALWTLGEILFEPRAPALVARMAPLERRGAWLGVWSLSRGLAYVMGPAAGAWALEAGGPLTLFAGGALVSLTTCALWWTCTRHLQLAGQRDCS